MKMKMKLRLTIPLITILGVLGDASLLWPKAKEFTSGNQIVKVDPASLSFLTTSKSPILLQAIERSKKLIESEKYTSIIPGYRPTVNNSTQLLNLVQVNLNVNSDSESLELETDESYTLAISLTSSNPADLNTYTASITSNTVYGSMYGLTTLIQLIQYDSNTNQRIIAKVPTTIKDFPKYKHRGLLLDTSRNYFPITDILRTIDGLAYTKMNVFHWHIMDSHSFPFKSQKHPNLYLNGAYGQDMLYSYEDIQAVVNYAKHRGVRVISEIEAPAHSYAMAKAYPNIGLCLDDPRWDQVAGQAPSGQLDPTNPLSTQIVADLIDEFNTLFPDKFMHLSGDEINLKCWSEAKSVQDYLKVNGGTVNDLSNNFTMKMHTKASTINKRIIVWEELVLNHNLKLPQNAVVQMWYKIEDTVKVINQGYAIIQSSVGNWYLDCGRGTWKGDAPNQNSPCDPYKHWQKVYTYDLTKNLNSNQQKAILGGEVAAWTELIDTNNLDALLWPRTNAASEVLWSDNKVNNVVTSTKYVAARLNNWRFRLQSRGFNPEPIQPLWCVQHPNRCDLPK